MKTIIKNTFTRYEKTIKTRGLPSLATIKNHLRASRARDCKSHTSITIDGTDYDVCDTGHGEQLVRQY